MTRGKFRKTPVRKEMINIISSAATPLSSKDILLLIETKGLCANKTTVYRELEFLKSERIIKEVIFNDGIARYEGTSDHHHHLVCSGCHKLETVNSSKVEEIFEALERKLNKKTQFKFIDHSLEFFGLCSNCQDEI